MGAIVAGLVVLGVAAGINHLRRTRARVMDYHHMETPRVNASTHGGGGGGGGGGG